MDTSKVWKWGTAAVLLILAVAFAFKSMNNGGDGAPPVRDARGAISQEGKTTIAFALTGDCIAELPSGNEAVVGKVTFVPCERDHMVEVAGFTETKDASGDGQLAFEQCTAIGVAFTGHQPTDPVRPYTLAILPPADGIPSFMCLVDYSATALGTPSSTPSQ